MNETPANAISWSLSIGFFLHIPVRYHDFLLGLLGIPRSIYTYHRTVDGTSLNACRLIGG